MNMRKELRPPLALSLGGATISPAPVSSHPAEYRRKPARSPLPLSTAALLGACALFAKADAAEVDLLQKYPTTLTTGDANPADARPWQFTAADVYHLTEFSFHLGSGFRVDVGAADVGVAHCVDGAVWAVVIPRDSGTLTSQVTNQPENVVSVWLRFHPSLIDQLFPPATTLDDGNQALAFEMAIIASVKFTSSWHAGNNAMIPDTDQMTVDVDTQGGPRRFFAVDTTAATAEYISAFENRPVPVPPAITPDLAASTFDQLWAAFDTDYAMFVLRPDVDWTALKNQERPLALASKSTYEFAGICADLLRPLRDLHVALTLSGAYVPVYDRPRPSNANPNAYSSLLGNLNRVTSALSWAVTDDHIGFIVIYNWTDTSLPTQFDSAMENMRDTRGLIIDVRLNGGGSEPLAQQVAARFLDQQVTYAYDQVRNGPLHTNLTAKIARTLSPRGPWRYDRPVLLLIGQRCMSSNESFIGMMSCAPQVVTMGDHTAGSSGNPETIQLPLSMTVNVPRWIDYLPDGVTPLDGIGFVPQVPFTPEAGAFDDTRDDLLSAALQRMATEPLPPNPIQEPGTTVPSGSTVCDIFLANGQVYHSATLDLQQFHIDTAYGQLTIPKDDLIRLTFSSAASNDVAATDLFVVTGHIEEEYFPGHTPGAPFDFQRADLKEIDFGLPPTLAVLSGKTPRRILWFSYSGWTPESIYESGGMGYSHVAQIAENLGAGNVEVNEQVELTPQLLADYDALVFLNRDSGVPLSSDEKLALRGFLGAGNGVLVIGQQDGGYPLSGAAQFANSVTMPYGIELTTMTPNTSSPPDSTHLVPHPITQGLSSAPGGGSLLVATPPAQILALTGTNSGVLAVSTFGAGRMIVVSDDSDLWDMTVDPTYTWAANDYNYAVNIFKWLLWEQPRLDPALRLASDGCHLSFRANAGQSVHLQRSPDLKTWSDVITLTASGIWQDVVDSTAPTEGNQFYRLMAP